MHYTKIALLVLWVGLFSCKAQEKYELVLQIKNSSAADGQIDSTLNVLKKRLKAYDKGKTIIAVSPNQQSITLQTACGDMDFIENVLVKKGSLVFYECYTLADPEIATAFQNVDEAMLASLQANTPIVPGVSNAFFQNERPLSRLISLNQGYQDRRTGMMQYPAAVGAILDSLLPLLEKCWPLLHQHLPQGCKLLFKKIHDRKYSGQEIYLVKNNATAFDASRHIADAVGDMDETKHPIVTMSFNKAGAQLWQSMTTKNVGRAIAIVVDDEVMSVPMVMSPIEGGNTQISGTFTFEEAQDLATALGSGYLPLTLQIGSIKALKGQ